jgi:RNA polymerase sigma-70 factor (ECF subfamily)
MNTIEFSNQLLNLEGSLEKFAYKLTQKIADAKDLVQDTFLKVLTNQDKYVNNKNFKAWTFTIMRNTFINHYRCKVLKNTFCDQTKESFYINQIAENPDSVYAAMEITQNIAQLKERFRLPFEMHIKGYKYQEIADKLNINIGTVKSRIFISRKQLMDQLNR